MMKNLKLHRYHRYHGSFDYNLFGLDSKYILILKDGNPIIGKFNDKNVNELNKSITNKTDRYWLDQLRFELLNENELNIVVGSDFVKSSIEKKLLSKSATLPRGPRHPRHPTIPT